MLTSRRGYRAAALSVAVGAVFGILSWGAIMGAPWDKRSGTLAGTGRERFELGINLNDNRKRLRFGPRWVPRLMAVVGYSPFADLSRAEISQKKSTKPT